MDSRLSDGVFTLGLFELGGGRLGRANLVRNDQEDFFVQLGVFPVRLVILGHILASRLDGHVFLRFFFYETKLQVNRFL